MFSQEINHNCLDICLNHKTTLLSLPDQKSEESILTSVSNPERWTRKFIKILIKCKIRKGRRREREGKKSEKQNRLGHAEMSAGRHWGEKKPETNLKINLGK